MKIKLSTLRQIIRESLNEVGYYRPQQTPTSITDAQVGWNKDEAGGVDANRFISMKVLTHLYPKGPEPAAQAYYERWAADLLSKIKDTTISYDERADASQKYNLFQRVLGAEQRYFASTRDKTYREPEDVGT